MHNMSNKFYNYLSDKIKNFFRNSEIRHGDKFFIQFDEMYRVDEFYNTLKNDLDNVENSYIFEIKQSKEGDILVSIDDEEEFDRLCKVIEDLTE